MKDKYQKINDEILTAWKEISAFSKSHESYAN